jgi:hypothetical protein
VPVRQYLAEYLKLTTTIKKMQESADKLKEKILKAPSEEWQVSATGGKYLWDEDSGSGVQFVSGSEGKSVIDKTKLLEYCKRSKLMQCLTYALNEDEVGNAIEKGVIPTDVIKGMMVPAKSSSSYIKMINKEPEAGEEENA